MRCSRGPALHTPRTTASTCATFHAKTSLASMQILGEWFPCNDGVIRPVVRGEIRAGDGSWLSTPFLLDTGADCTAFDYYTGTTPGFGPTPQEPRLGGVGGVVGATLLPTEVRLTDDAGRKIVFRSQGAAATAPAALD